MCGSSPPPRICPPPPLVLMGAALLSMDLSPYIPPSTCDASRGRGPSVWKNDKDARGDTPCPPHSHNHLCPTMSPSPPILPLARDHGSSDRCSYPCLSLSPSRETGGAQAAVPTPCTQLIFFMFFFYFFPPFPPFLPSPFLSCPPPHSFLSLSSLHFSKVSQPCPPNAGATRMGTPSGWGHLLPPV